MRFGEIQKFVIAQEPIAIVLEFEPYHKSILKQAGPPCRQMLKSYADIDILSEYVHAIKPNPTKITIVPVRNSIGKAVLIAPPELDCIFLMQQPNNLEHH